MQYTDMLKDLILNEDGKPVMSEDKIFATRCNDRSNQVDWRYSWESNKPSDRRRITQKLNGC